LKIIEAGCKRMPILCSNIETYFRVDGEMSGKGILFAQNQKEWSDNFLELAGNVNKIEDMGEALHEYVVSKYDLMTENKVRDHLLKSLL